MQPAIPASFSEVALEGDAEKQQLTLFQWLSTLEQDIQKAPVETLKSSQQRLEELLLKTLSQSQPKPSRAVRTLVARCLNSLFQRGDARSVFDVLASLQKSLADKNLGETNKIAHVYVLGVLSESKGSNVLSLFAESANLLIKILKNSSDIAPRYEACMALSRVLNGQGRAAQDQVIKDLLKQGKNGLSDKVLLMRAASAEMLRSLYLNTALSAPPSSLYDFDSLLSTFTKAFEGSNTTVRKAVASLVATVLSLSQRPQIEPKSVKSSPSKTDKSETDDTGGAGNATSANTGPANMILTIEEMLNLLSSYFIKTTVREVRVGVIESYAMLMKHFGIRWVEVNYSVISRHLIDLAGNPKLTTSKTECLTMREFIGFLLRDIIGKMLGESAQMTAVKDLTSTWLKADLTKVSKNSLVLALNELAALCVDLGPAGSGVTGELIDPLIHILTKYPSTSVSIGTAWCLRSVCTSIPMLLPVCMNRLVGMLQSEIASRLTDKPETLRKLHGVCHGICALIAVARDTRCIYLGFDVFGKIFAAAAQLLKAAIYVANPSSSTNSSPPTGVSNNLKVTTLQSYIGWSLMSAMVTVGPNFTKAHSSQLLLHWKNTFAKQPSSAPQSQQALVPKTEPEWYFAIGLRSCALCCLENFITCNPSLVTPEISKRIALLLNNTLSFVTSIPPAFTSLSAPGSASAGANSMTIQVMEAQLRSRLFTCYRMIASTSPSLFDSTAILMVSACIQTFAPDADKLFAQDVPSKSNSHTSPRIDLLVSTGLIKEMQVTVAGHLGAEERGVARSMARDLDMARVEALADPTALGALEFGADGLYANAFRANAGPRQPLTRPTPLPAGINVIDSAIELWGLLVSCQPTNIQEQYFDQVLKMSRVVANHQKLSTGKKNAIRLNALVASFCAVKHMVSMKKNTPQLSTRAYETIRELTSEAFRTGNESLRVVAAELLGNLCRTAPTATINALIQSLIDEVVQNRDPDARAGSCLALGCVLSQLGGMAASSHLKTVIGVLHTLSIDAHPGVHIWALRALWLTVESAGLMFGPFVNASLGLLAKLEMTESHDPIISGSHQGNRSGESEVDIICGRILYAVINNVGPELSTMQRIRELCFHLYGLFKGDTNVLVVAEAIRCIQHFITFAPQSVDVPLLLPFLQMQLSGDVFTHPPVLRRAAVTCLYQLSQRHAEIVISSAVDLEEQLFALLDTEAADQMVRDEIKDTLLNLLKTVAPRAPSRWLDLCKKIMSRSVAPSAASSNGPPAGQQSEDDEEFISSDEDSSKKNASGSVATQAQTASVTVVLYPRWRTQVFALFCLRQVLHVMGSTSAKEHVDLKAAREARAQLGSSRCDFLIFRLSDLVRIGFTAATANVEDLRLEGLQLLKDVIEKFRETEDPDFEDHALLEQYQAQFGSALSPAFGADASPEVTATACQVCAAYVSSGVNRELATLSRVLKLLSTSLDRYRKDDDKVEQSNTTVWNTPSPQAGIIVKLAVLTAWGELHLASLRQTYIQEAVRPQLGVLSSLWTSLLRDYARIKLDSDSIASSAVPLALGSNAGSNEGGREMYLAATKEVLYPFYKRSWVVLMRALLSLVDTEDNVIAAIFSEDEVRGSAKPGKIFYTLFGLCIEALSSLGTGDLGANTFSGMEDVRNATRNLIECLVKLARPQIAGNTFIPNEVYMEVMNVLERLSQVEGVAAQLAIAQFIQRVIADYGAAYLMNSENGPLSRDNKLHATTRVLFNVLKCHIPAMSNDPLATVYSTQRLTVESAALIVVSVDAMTSLVLSLSQNNDNTSVAALPVLLPTLLCLFSAILQSPKLAADVTPRALICLKVLLEGLKPGTLNQDEHLELRASMVALTNNLLDNIDSEVEDLTNASHASPSESPVPVDSNVAKNSLLAVAILLTSNPSLTFEGRTFDRFFNLLTSLLVNDLPALSTIATQCVRSLVAVMAKSQEQESDYSAIYVQKIIPRILTVILEFSKNSSKVDPSRLPVIEESIKTLVALYTLTPIDSSKTSFLAVLIATLVTFLLDPNSMSTLPQPQRYMHVICTQILFNLASTSPTDFKTVLMALPDSMKARIQVALTWYATSQHTLANATGGLNMSNSTFGTENTPNIQLKANFANF